MGGSLSRMAQISVPQGEMESGAEKMGRLERLYGEYLADSIVERNAFLKADRISRSMMITYDGGAFPSSSYNLKRRLYEVQTDFPQVCT